MATSPNRAKPAPPRGRGATSNPRNRFEPLELEATEDGLAEAPDRLPTQLFRDHSRVALASNDSPDVPFDRSLNPYRGCEHGCIYCYARPSHEHLGFSAGLDFETKIVVKENAPELLRRELDSKRYEPTVIGISGVTDPYQPIERRLRLTRRCLEVLAEYRNPVQIITKNRLVTRDLDLLAELAAHQAAHVMLSITTLDASLVAKMEPRTSSPTHRLRALEQLSAAGVSCGVLVAPVIPGLNDHEIPSILEAAAKAGARNAGFVTLRLPYGLKELFDDWLVEHFPDRRDKILARLRDLRDGALNDARFGSRMRGEGAFAEQIAQLFDLHRRRNALERRGLELSTAAFRRPGGVQLDLL